VWPSCDVQNRLLEEVVNDPSLLRTAPRKISPLVTMSKRLYSLLLGVRPSSGALVLILGIDQNIISAGEDHNSLLTLGMSAYHCTRLECHINKSSLIADSPSADGSRFSIIQGEIDSVCVSAPSNDAKGQGVPSEVRRSIDTPNRRNRELNTRKQRGSRCERTLEVTSSASWRRNHSSGWSMRTG